MLVLLITHPFFAGAAAPDLAINESAVKPHITYRTFLDTDCEVVEGCNVAGTRRLLSFETEIRNIGAGDLDVGRPQSNTNFHWAPCHGHYHFEEFAHYRLLDSSGNEVVTANKMAFCLEDTYRWRQDANASRRFSCNTTQGIQAGWADVYDPTVPCQNIDITDLPGGEYILELTLDPKNLFAESDETNNTVRVPVTLPSDCVAPTNDAFASGRVLSGAAAVAIGNNGCATKEPGEPDHAAVTGGHSVWYRWTAAASGSAEIDTVGSDFDTVLAVYTGDSVDALTLIAENDDIVPFSNRQSSVTFSAVAGRLYHIAVDGWEGEVGRVMLKINGPANDAFGSCATLTGLAGQITGNNIGASREQTEPAHAGNFGGRSVWYCWTAPTNTVVTLDTPGSSIDTLLAVYTGADVTSLTEIASDDDSGTNHTSRLSFAATTGTTYHIAVDNFSGTAPGNFTLRWVSATPTPPTPPPSDIRLTLRRLTTGNTEVKLHAPRGAYQLQASTNFSGSSWATLTTLIISGNPFPFTDTNGTAHTRFYRALRQP